MKIKNFIHTMAPLKHCNNQIKKNANEWDLSNLWKCRDLDLNIKQRETFNALGINRCMRIEKRKLHVMPTRFLGPLFNARKICNVPSSFKTKNIFIFLIWTGIKILRL